MSRKAKCQGVLGLLLGHKFNNRHWDTEGWYDTDYCQRCGMPLGGWAT